MRQNTHFPIHPALRFCLVFLALGAGLSSHPLRGSAFGTSVWSNTGSDFFTASNYSPTVGNNAGGSGTTFGTTILYFEGDTVEPTMAASGTVEGIYGTTGLTQNLTVTNIASSALTLTLSGGLSVNGIRSALQVDDPGNYGLTIGSSSANINIVLAGITAFYVNNTGTLAINGTVSLGNGTAGTNTLTLGGSAAGAIVLNGAVMDGSNTKSGTVTINTSGSVYLNATGTYSGLTTLTAGNVTVGANSAFGSGAVTFTAGTLSSSTSAYLNNTFAPATGTTFGGSNNLEIANVVTTGSTSIFGNNTATLAFDNVTIGTGSTTTATFTVKGSGNTSLSNIANSASGALGALTYSGTGTLDLPTANTYSGGTKLSGGSTVIGNSSSFGSGTLTLAGGASGTLSASTALTGTSKVSNAISVDQTVTTGPAITFTGTNNLELGGTMTDIIGTNSAISNNITGGTLTISGIVQGDATAAANLFVEGSGLTNISGQVENNGTSFGFGLFYEGTGTLQLSNTESNSTIGVGGNLGTTEGTVQMLSGGSLGTALLDVDDGTFDLNGTTQDAKSGINMAGTGGTGGAAGTTSTILIGSGELLLGGNLNYDPSTGVAAGAAVVSAVGGGTLALNDGTSTITRAMDIFSSSANTGITPDLTISAAIVNGNGTAGLNKLGAGTLAVTNTNTYTGSTTVSAGTLEVDGSLSASSSVYVSSTTSTVLGILSGSGTINGAVTLGQTAAGVTSSGAISTTSLVTGNPYATLTLAGGLTWNKAGTLNFNLGPSGQSGLLQLNSTAFNASVASPTTGYTFNFTNDGATVGTTYILVDYGTTNFTSATDFSASGGITGTFMENSLGGGLNDLTFTVTATPEPGAWVMMILGGLALALFESRRRRQTASTASVEELE